jgi:hypothetical protein
MARRHPGSTPATCDPPGYPNSTTPSEPGNSNSTSDSPPPIPTQSDNGGNCSPQRFPASPRTHSFLELTEMLTNLSQAGVDTTLLVRSAAGRPLPDDHPAAALWWRILDQLPHQHRPRTLQPRRKSHRRDREPRRHPSSDHGRDRRRLPRPG